MQKLNINSRVRLRSFNGTTKPVGEVSANENYWKLIGKSGTIVEDEKEREFITDKTRLLVFFDDDLGALGLENHNSIKNSLWIRGEDLVLEMTQ